MKCKVLLDKLKPDTNILSLRIWVFTAMSLTASVLFIEQVPFDKLFLALLVGFAVSLVAGLPALIVLAITTWLIKKLIHHSLSRIICLLIIEFIIVACYAAIVIILELYDLRSFHMILSFFIILFASAIFGTFINYRYLVNVFGGFLKWSLPDGNYNFLHKTIKMETHREYPSSKRSNRVMIKGFIAGGLILFLMIPTIFIANLVEEREQRQKEVVKEVSAKWATSQTIAGPFLVAPYSEKQIDEKGAVTFIKKPLIILSKNMDVDGKIFPESRPRSIYKVLLYKSDVNIKGLFQPQWPEDIDTSLVDLSNAKLCFSISDFKGIEEELKINFNNELLTLHPGLPANNFRSLGLSVPIEITPAMLDNGIAYSMKVKLKGSEKMHFIPLSANSSFKLTSSWADPSFDGNTLPASRAVSDSGFTANWNYNQANLPFSTVFHSSGISEDLSFGVSLVQTADHYNKIMRSVKYAILIIGLTFALIFILELIQDNPFHPVQYVLVGLALVIFYSLLLAFSEYILFEWAYLIAAVATITLITLYANSHFRNWKTSLIFSSVLGSLYGFIFILLRLEDTALLVGSLGLFIILAIVMYLSRKVDWYGSGVQPGV